MQQHIYKYFALNRSVSLPGIGSFSVETQNAKLDFIDKTLYAPVYTICYTRHESPDEKFYRFLSKETGVEESRAIEDLKIFSVNLQEQLEKDDPINLQLIGTLKKNGSGYSFVPDNTVQKYFPTITAER